MNKQFSNQPLVSIIMNCYNGETYLRESIDTIISQTYKNWELIFWDNQSKDSSSEIFKSYKDPRFKYYYAKKHTSLYEARNLAIEKSNGDLIAFIDTDDLWKENKLELQIPYFDDPHVGLVFSNYWVIKKKIKKKKLHTNKKLPSGNIYDKLIENYSIGIITAVIRRKHYLKLEKKFDERFTIIGDFDLFLRLSKLYLFKSIQNPLAYYRLHGRNLSIINVNKEIEELDVWLRENKLNLGKLHIKKITKSVDHRRFVKLKIEGRLRESLIMLLKLKVNPFKIKNLIIFFMPIFILKKFLWYHQD